MHPNVDTTELLPLPQVRFTLNADYEEELASFCRRTLLLYRDFKRDGMRFIGHLDNDVMTVTLELSPKAYVKLLRRKLNLVDSPTVESERTIFHKENESSYSELLLEARKYFDLQEHSSHYVMKRLVLLGKGHYLYCR